MKRKAKASGCKYFKSTGAPFGGCKHPDAHNACLNHFIDECKMGKRKYKLKAETK